VALLSCRLWWQRIAVSVLAVPVAVLMNVLRVTVLGLLTLGDRDLAQGEAHTLIGTLLLLPGLGTFLLIVWTLKKVVDVPDEAAPRGGVFAPRVLRPAPVVLLGLLIASAVGMTWAIGEYRYHLDKLPIYAPENRTLASLPKETDRWRAVGPDRIESAEMLEELGTLNYVTRTYTEKQPPAGRGPRTIELHATYYTDQIETVPHVPERCFVGGGLQQAAESRVLPLSLDRSAWIADPNAPEGEPAVQTARTSSRWSDGRGKRVRLPRGIETVGLRTSEYVLPFHGELYAGYFFVANGSVAANATEVLAMAYDLRDDYAYFMKVQFNGFKKGSIDSPEALAEASADLLGELLPDLMLCVPDWVEVTQGRYPADRGEARASR
jgi:exosortase/archaeosortase family protein